jgi:hypothetical protein
MVQLALYADGSGEHGKGTFVVAGYLAGTIDWFDIETQWCARLREHPKIEYFKASDCFHLRGQFEGWKRADADAKRERLAEIIRDNGEHLVEISSTIRWDEYNSAMGDGITKHALYTPYFFCFNGVIAEAVAHANENKWHGRIAFVFDTESNANLDGDAEVQYKHARDTLPEVIRNRMGSATWDSDIKFPSLQIADLIAWSVRAEMEKLGSPALELLRKRIAKSVRREWNASGIAQMVIDMDEQESSRPSHAP